MSVTELSLGYICDLVRKHAAIVLDSEKEYFVETRLIPLAQREGYGTIENLVGWLSVNSFGSLHQKVIEAITINETSFFRDNQPFEALKNLIIPELIKRRASERQLHIWCGACSTGQEPYSLAMLFREHFPELNSWSIRIFGTDISNGVLEKAQNGIFSQFVVNRGLPITYLMKYFRKEGMDWRINEDIRKMIEFRQMNLAGSWFPMPASDIVMMRNVMIYFDMEMKRKILEKIRGILRPDGTLFIGSTETMINLNNSYKMIDVALSGVYQPRC